MDSRYDIIIWILSFTIITAGIWGINNLDIDIEEIISPNEQKEDFYIALNKIQINPVSNKDMVMSILERELSETKLPLLRRIEIKDGEVYVILYYNDIPCRLGNFDDLNIKLDLILKIFNTARKKGIRLREIDVRSLKFPTIVEGE